jgi:hypothetical protein
VTTKLETSAELIAEAKRRTQRAMPSLTDEQWSAWIIAVAKRRGRIELTPDGATAHYEVESSPRGNVARANATSNPTPQET